MIHINVYIYIYIQYIMHVYMYNLTHTICQQIQFHETNTSKYPYPPLLALPRISKRQDSFSQRGQVSQAGFPSSKVLCMWQSGVGPQSFIKRFSFHSAASKPMETTLVEAQHWISLGEMNVVLIKYSDELALIWFWMCKVQTCANTF